MARWRHATHDGHAQPLLTMTNQKDLRKRHQEDHRKIKRLQQELRRKDKALAEKAELLIASKNDPDLLGLGRGGLTISGDRRRSREIHESNVVAKAKAREVAILLRG